MCPRCGRMLKGSFTARKHPVNLLRRDALLNKLVAEYEPRTTMQRATCEHLAGVLEQLESLKPGSTEHQRLVQLSQQLGEALEASRSTQAHVSNADYDALTDDQLIERTSAILCRLLEMRDEQQKGEAYVAAAVAEHAGLPGEASVTSAGEAVVPTLAPAPEPVCQYCHRKCVGPDHVAYDVLHYNDPQEIKKRDEFATRTMMRQLGKPLPDWYRE